ncbi:MAG: glycoside hydrolase family 78 protein, partial [Puniceicoccales bacterium]|nr:glycoside hydrolase family 78 protein [Puniceicoccales bacterium]
AGTTPVLNPPRFSWKTATGAPNFIQGGYQIIVASSPEKLAANTGDIWDSGRVASRDSVLVPFAGDARKLVANGLYFWKARAWDAAGNALPWSDPQRFSVGLLGESDWRGADWLALEKDNPKERIVPGLSGPGNVRQGRKLRTAPHYKMPQFRKEFAVRADLARATAYVAGLGHFEFFLNGEKVGSRFLDAGWTKFDKEALYVTFDVTRQLRAGAANAAGVMLGGGFYDTPAERYLKVLISHGAPKMRLLLRLEYTDGSVENVVSDTSWRAAPSAITFCSIYGGEDFDANLEQRGWKSAGFDDSAWAPALRVSYEGKLRSMRATPLAVRAVLPPKKVFKNKRGAWIYDLGQNASGIIRVTARPPAAPPATPPAASKTKPPAAQKITFRPGELLRTAKDDKSDVTVSQGSCGSPYILAFTPRAGAGAQTWQPQFTYYGFRYVQVEGAVPAGEPNPAGLPEIVALEGLHTANSAAQTGDFTCSKPIFNDTHKLIDWALRSNMASVLTDCPHREKLGWLEEAHLMQPSLLYRYNLARLYGKIMNDIAASQLPNGCVPTIAPEYVRFNGGFEDTPEWGSAFIISPWFHYRFFADRRLLERHYPAMQRYLDYLSSRAKNHIVAYGLGDWYDIGPRHPGRAQLTANGVTATAIYYYNTTILRDAATLLGKPADAARYAALADKIKHAFNTKFFNPDTAQIERGSQTANAMALHVGLVADADKPRVLANLVADIRRRKNALTAGDVGYRYVVRALEENGRSDVLYDMNTRSDVPGYGWILRSGATALTESWQAYGHVSNNHFMLGHLFEWFYSGLAGIRQKPTSVGFRDLLIAPQPVGDLTSARATYETPYGTVESAWEITGGTGGEKSTAGGKSTTTGTGDKTAGGKKFHLRVRIPPNTTAEVVLPDGAKKTVGSGVWEF